MYRKLSNGYHPTYQAVYGCFSIGILLNWLMKGQNKWKWLKIGLSVLLSVYVGLLASKAGILCLAALLMFLAFHQARDKHKRKLVFLHAGLFAILMVSVLGVPKSSSRFEQVIAAAAGQEDAEIATSSSQARLVAWRSAVDVMLEKPFGVGTGDVKAALIEKYEEQGELFAEEKQLNAHNQFLQSGVEHGWWGMLLLLGVCVLALLEAIRMKNRLLTIFILICGFNMLFESFLELQAGIVFFCFFLTLLSQSRSDARVSS
jgi:O-antigen ligase